MKDIIVSICLIIPGFVILYHVLKKRLMKSVNTDSMISEIRKEINQIVIELNSTTERNIGLVEDRINNISELLTKADKKILLLQRESEKYSISKNYNNIIAKASAKQEAPRAEEGIREKVIRLHKEGIASNIISSRMDIPVGEIELMISLNER